MANKRKLKTMKAPIKVVMLPTGLPILKGQLAILDGKTSIYSFDMKDEHPAEAQYAYVTVSQDVELIKIGDYVIQTNFEKTHSSLILIENEMQCKFANDTSGSFTKRKIIATSDLKLTIDKWEKDYPTEPLKVNLPQLQQSFLKEFVANPDREFEVEYETKTLMKPADVYVEEVKTKLKLNQDNTVNITSVEEKMYSLSDLERLGDYAYMNAKSTWDWKKFIKENL